MKKRHPIVLAALGLPLGAALLSATVFSRNHQEAPPATAEVTERPAPRRAPPRLATEPMPAPAEPAPAPAPAAAAGAPSSDTAWRPDPQEVQRFAERRREAMKRKSAWIVQTLALAGEEATAVQRIYDSLEAARGEVQHRMLAGTTPVKDAAAELDDLQAGAEQSLSALLGPARFDDLIQRYRAAGSLVVSR